MFTISDRTLFYEGSAFAELLTPLGKPGAISFTRHADAVSELHAFNPEHIFDQTDLDEARDEGHDAGHTEGYEEGRQDAVTDDD